MTNVLTVVISELMADLLVDFPVTTEQSACVPVARKKNPDWQWGFAESQDLLQVARQGSMSQASDPLHVCLWVKVFLSVFFFFKWE